jgi:Rne/Rng family ribonuclease
LVFAPEANRSAVSGRIRDGAERERLLQALDSIETGSGGLIARTAAVGAAVEPLSAEAAELIQRWQTIRQRAAERGTPGLIQREPGLLERWLRDAPLAELEAVIFDDPADRARAQEILNALELPRPTRLRLHCGAASLFEEHAVFTAVERALRPGVRLPTGGRLVIEETEALISIDVDSGQHAAAADAERTAFQVNLEAAREFPRQLRLRALAGAVVVDLIRMHEETSRRQVIHEVERSAARDRGRLRVAELGELGLLQLTRRRSGPSLAESVADPCPRCRAAGRLKNARLVVAQVIEALRKQVRVSPQSTTFQVCAAASVLAELEACAAGNELWPGAGPLTLSYEVLDAKDPQDRFEVRRAS